MKPREIKAELIRKGISMTDIADEAGVSLPEVSMCISGNKLYMKIRRVIAKKLKMTVDEIFGGDDHPQPKRTFCRVA